MAMKIVLAFDSFKGSLRSNEVADAFEEGVRTVIPDCEITKAHIADGGEGTMSAISQSLNGAVTEMCVKGPTGKPVMARYATIDNGRTALVEMAEASGLTLLEEKDRNPLLTSTYGTGELIADALRKGCRKFIVGIGGSATNDGGAGLLRALGFRFLDENGNALDGRGKDLKDIRHIDESEVMCGVKGSEFIIACDVTNPLYGPNGAAYVFAPQKGADAQMAELLDSGLKNLAEVITRHNGIVVDDLPGGGAAGGMGAGMYGLLNAQLKRGIEVVLDTMRFDNMLEGCDLVVTGEGCIDSQTLMGKAPIGVLQRASAKIIPVVAIGGEVRLCRELERTGFKEIVSINDKGLPKEKAMQRSIAYDNVKRAGESIALRYATSSSRK